MTYFILIAVVSLIALIGTLIVGFSQSNKEGNPDYFKKNKRNWSRLIVIYIIGAVVFFVIMYYFR